VERTSVALFVTLQTDGMQCEVATGSIAFLEKLNISLLSRSSPSICQGISHLCDKKFPACLSRNSPPICQELSGPFIKNFPAFVKKFSLICKEIPRPFVKKFPVRLSKKNYFPICQEISSLLSISFLSVCQ
jgi:hypothetical protein